MVRSSPNVIRTCRSRTTGCVIIPNHPLESEDGAMTQLFSFPCFFPQREGHLPEAVCNWLAMLGWNPGTTQEVSTSNNETHFCPMSSILVSPLNFLSPSDFAPNVSGVHFGGIGGSFRSYEGPEGREPSEFSETPLVQQNSCQSAKPSSHQ